MNKLSIAIITLNEEKNIRRCLKSVEWADDVVILDSGSTDRTKEICYGFGCRVFETEWLGFGKTKQKAVNLCKNNWVLVLDADEELTNKLTQKIKQILRNPQASGYRIKRDSFYLNQKIKYCGWRKDYPLRLFNKKKGAFDDKIVHETIIIPDGNIRKIKQPMLHYTYPKLEDHINKMLHYSRLNAKAQRKEKKSCIAVAIFHGLFKFIKMYFIKLGFLDGKKGFLLSFNSAFGVYLKYLYIWEYQHER